MTTPVSSLRAASVRVWLRDDGTIRLAPDGGNEPHPDNVLDAIPAALMSKVEAAVEALSSVAAQLPSVDQAASIFFVGRGKTARIGIPLTRDEIEAIRTALAALVTP